MKHALKELASGIFHGDPGTIFRAYIATILTIFSAFYFCNVPLCRGQGVGDTFHDLFLAPNYWWGVASLIGAASLIFRSKLDSWHEGHVAGDIIAVITFVYLSYDFIVEKPPMYAGGVLSGTAAIFLVGGMIHDRRTLQG